MENPDQLGNHRMDPGENFGSREPWDPFFPTPTKHDGCSIEPTPDQTLNPVTSYHVRSSRSLPNDPFDVRAPLRIEIGELTLQRPDEDQQLCVIHPSQLRLDLGEREDIPAEDCTTTRPKYKAEPVAIAA